MRNFMSEKKLQIAKVLNLECLIKKRSYTLYLSDVVTCEDDVINVN